MSYILASALMASALLVGACADDPQYIDPQTPLRSVAVDPNDPLSTPASATIDLPIKVLAQNTAAQRKRASLAQETGIAEDAIPYARLRELNVSIEWSIENQSDTRGEATILIDGATEFAAFVPSAFVVDPEEDETPPSLMGGIPRLVEPGETISGVFREDQLREAAIDLELMFRAEFNPFAAILQVNKATTEITALDGTVIPAKLFASMVSFTITFQATTDMVLQFAIRVRDEGNLLHKQLLAAPVGELEVFSPVQIMPPAPDPAP